MRIACLTPAVALAAAGCISHPGTAAPTDREDLSREEGWLLVSDVEFLPQRTDQDCGAASLAMVLARWGLDVPVATLHEECTVAGQPGLRATALRDAARRRGFSAFLFAGSVEDLEYEIRRGRPVVVGLVKSQGPLATSHFEVVVGLRKDGGPAEIAALDPARGLVRDALPAFAREWAATSGTTLVVFRPAPSAATQTAGGP
jgi:ABC-type bacteriocin/lantibiotic exporter with double-glycine peptidase domain